MAADFDLLGVRAHVVGVMHHVARQPQHPALDRVERRQILGAVTMIGCSARLGLNRRHRTCSSRRR
jgi:hypothetical protein